MGGTIRARVRGRVLEPLDPFALPEGKEVTVTILDVPGGRDAEVFRRSHGGWKGTIDAEALIRNVRESRQVSGRFS